jgi:hypothetical protein
VGSGLLLVSACFQQTPPHSNVPLCGAVCGTRKAYMLVSVLSCLPSSMTKPCWSLLQDAADACSQTQHSNN